MFYFSTKTAVLVDNINWRYVSKLKVVSKICKFLKYGSIAPQKLSFSWNWANLVDYEIANIVYHHLKSSGNSKNPSIFDLHHIWIIARNKWVIWSYCGPRFPAFGLNMERYGVSLCSVQILENTDQNNSEKGHFHAV